MKKLLLCSASFAAVMLAGCMTMKVEPIKIEVTVKVQVEKDLSNFFGDIDSATPAAPSASDDNLSQGDKQ